jgi:hypothetical protein
MIRKSVIKVSFNEEAQSESYYFIKRLIEKILIDQLNTTPKIKGSLLISSSKILEEDDH